MVVRKMDTVIVGGGQAGLATSYWLKQFGRSHLILEQADQAAPAWRDGRWDSFTFVTPNWASQLPGAEYRGPHPDAFLTKNQAIAYFQQYVSKFQLPLQCNTRVTAVEPKSGHRGYLVYTNDSAFDADHVVVATGLFQRPKSQPLAQRLSPDITQMHSGEYRNPGRLPSGAVLVVGSSQSGCQIADEIHQSGRKVFLCVGGAGRIPRRYRGKDICDWMRLLGFYDRTVAMLPSPKVKFLGNPHVSGKSGSQNINLHQFARDGIQLLGRLKEAQGDHITLALDLKDNLAKADKSESEFLRSIDAYIAKNGINAPPEKMPQLQDGFDVADIEHLDLKSANITTVIWATGYDFDFNFVKVPAFDEDGYPLQIRGVTRFPGLYFVGLPWLYKQNSGLLSGVGEDARFIASAIAANHAADGAGLENVMDALTVARP
jgi:putative flavoprotein involved in K+ transport